MSAKPAPGPTESTPEPLVLPPARGAMTGLDHGAHRSPPWSTATKSIFAVATLLLVVLVIWRFNELIRPLIYAVILAYLLNPLVGLSERRFRMSRGAAVGVIYGGALLITAGLLVGIGFVAVDQTERLITELPRLSQSALNYMIENVTGREIRLGTFTLFTFPATIDAATIEAILGQIATRLNLSIASGGALAAQVASGALSILSTFFVVMFVAIYLSKDGPFFWGMISDFFTTPGYRDDAERLGRDFVRIWSAYLRGQVLLGISMFVLVSLTLAVLNVNYSLALGGVAGLVEFLPVIGPTISTAAATLVAVFQDSNWLGLSPVWYGVVVFVAMLALQQLEQALLVPRFVGEALDLHPVTVIVVVLMGTSLAGILGAVLAAPVAATVKLIGGYGWRKTFDLPPFPEPEPADETQHTQSIGQRLKALWSRKSPSAPPAADKAARSTQSTTRK